jgi:hypothetical protein
MHGAPTLSGKVRNKGVEPQTAEFSVARESEPFRGLKSPMPHPLAWRQINQGVSIPHAAACPQKNTGCLTVENQADEASPRNGSLSYFSQCE